MPPDLPSFPARQATRTESFAGKVAVVTGASTGTGQAIAVDSGFTA
ncbi:MULTISPECIES: hypothetical protein [Burkholderia]|nr:MULTISPECIES: hypothetical protein [Burkholderia]